MSLEISLFLFYFLICIMCVLLEMYKWRVVQYNQTCINSPYNEQRGHSISDHLCVFFLRSYSS
ncbi:uncharacterized protein BDW43DRAFT_205039 [Aspergillus alliaceus]|uniref:uncharacterized protein n=1 Tax=Petromyces alliaceus TaxID=209559 RepID=UPI0012A6A33E|nr:uncharacterized protein BDW43DRAFT_205039 [Aspergillus alliaceus]KAB8237345.1 hypothetical protein BDW43DRAFT_205039 [Aspergillus alliaceus]